MPLLMKGAILFIFTLITAFISSSDAAFFSLNRHQVCAFKDDKKKKAVYSLLKNPKHLLVLFIFFNLLSEIIIQQVIAQEEQSLWNTIVIPFVFIVCCGELIPKAWGFKNNESLAIRVASFFEKSQRLMMPFLNWVVHLSSYVSDRLFWFVPHQAPLDSEEFQAMLKLSLQKEVLTKSEVTLIQQLVQAKEISIENIMHPIPKCLFLHEEKTLLERHELIEKSDSLFYPIKRRGKWLGIATREQAIIEKTFTSHSLENYSLPHTSNGYEALKKMLSASNNVSWVVDANKEVIGMLTQKSLIDSLTIRNFSMQSGNL